VVPSQTGALDERAFFVTFTTNQHHIWEILFERQMPNVAKFACREFLEGFELLQLSPKQIPSLTQLNRQITPRTGWTVTRTNSRYMTRAEWFTALSRKHFPITGYIRTQAELDFTPEPDIFHDVFGHQPFMTLPKYVEIFDLFGQAYKKAKTDQQKKDLGRLAWFGYEFGLIQENGELKAFGAGLLSSLSEIQSIDSPDIIKRPFVVEDVIAGRKPDGHREGDRVYGVTENTELFVLDSLDHYKRELTRYFQSL